MRRRAFSSFEALVVILIIGTIVVIFMQEYQRMIWKARWVQALATMNAIRRAQIFYYNEYQSYADGIPDAKTGRDYADSADDLNLWFKRHSMDMIDIPESSFKYFNYDVSVPPDGGRDSVMAVRSDKGNPRPDPKENYGVKLDLESGKLEYNPKHYP